MVQKVSGWVTFKFSLPRQDSEKTNHKELELALNPTSPLQFSLQLLPNNS